MIIYKVTNLINEKIYIGQSIKTLDERKKEHYKNRKHKNYVFYRALNKYGLENFKWEILFEDDQANYGDYQKKLNELEIYYIQLFKSSENEYGYNSTLGGHNGIPNEEIKSILSKKAKIRYEDPAERKKISDSKKGQIISEAHKEKTSRTLKERYKDPKERERLSKQQKGKYTGENSPNFGKTGKLSPIYGTKRSDDTKIKIGLASKGRTHSQESKDKMSISRIGKKHSEQTKLKLSEARKGDKNHNFGKTGENNWFYGKHHSEECKKRMSEMKKGIYSGANHPKAKKIKDTLTGKVYDCAKDCALDLNIDYGKFRQRLHQNNFNYKERFVYI